MTMTYELFLFWVFGATATGAALMRDHGAQPGARRAVPGAVLLHRRRDLAAAEAEFLAIVLVLVYVGAVMVLFLFVVMMLDINLAPLREGFTKYLPAGLVVAAGDGRRCCCW
jgi:NADH-quinone oxidoreductase subunit J